MSNVFVLGSFVVDLACRTPHLPTRGETVFAGPFKMGPGGKGSNQAIAARRAGAEVTFLTKLGDDDFGEMARRTFATEELDFRHVAESVTEETGAALIMVEEKSAENMITVSVGACNHITLAEVKAAEGDIACAKIFLTQLETNLDATFEGVRLARLHRVPVVLNPAPVQEFNASHYHDIDYFTPNETEAAKLAGVAVTNRAEAEKAADIFLARGVKNAVITLGKDGVLVKNAELCEHVPAFDIGAAVDTTGAGDAFNGGFACALAEGKDIVAATRFGCAVAGLSVTRPGTAPAMPYREEIKKLLAGTWRPKAVPQGAVA